MVTGDEDIVVPEMEIPVPAEYVVLVSVELMVKLGYDPDMEVAPDPVSVTVWSGALFVMVVPEMEIPVPPVKDADVALMTPLLSIEMLVPAEKAPRMLLLVTRVYV